MLGIGLFYGVRAVSNHRSGGVSECPCVTGFQGNISSALGGSNTDHGYGIAVDGADLALWQQNYDPIGSGDIAVESIVESSPVGGLALEPISDEEPEAVSIAATQLGSAEPVAPGVALGVSVIDDEVSAIEQAAIATTRPHGGKRLAVAQDEMVDVLALAQLDVPLGV